MGIIDLVPVMPYEMPADASPQYRELFADVKHAMLPFYVCTAWFIIEGDRGKSLVQRLSVVAGDGKETFFPEVNEFPTTSVVNRAVQLVPGIGLRMLGAHQIRIYCKSQDEEEWTQYGAIPFVAVDAQTVTAPEAASPKPKRSYRRKK